MDIRSAYVHTFGHQPHLVVRAPGRVNLIGEHVDYNHGPVMPMAIDRYVWVAASPLPDRQVQITSLDFEAHTEFSLEHLAAKTDIHGEALPHWARYPAGVAWALQAEGLPVCGIQAVFASNLPIGAGLSSSAAVEAAFARLWQAFGGWLVEAVKLALICQRAENEYVGVNCGLMDQFSSLCGVEGHALYFETHTLEWEAAPLPPQTVVVIADSGVRRQLSHSAYNQRRAACEEAVRLLGKYKPGLASLNEISLTEFAAYGYYLPEEVRKRAEHVVREIARVRTALTALKRQDKQTFGALMYASHKSLKELYEVSTPELDTLVELARQQPGAIGARLTGAGFGGCTVNLVEASQAPAFLEGLVEGYRHACGREAQAFICQASQGAMALSNHLVQST